jgi:hypothetical protein
MSQFATEAIRLELSSTLQLFGRLDRLKKLGFSFVRIAQRDCHEESSMKLAIFLAAVCATGSTAPTFAQDACRADQAKNFTVKLVRLGTESVNDGGKSVGRVFGDISVNGQVVGRFYENPDKIIPAGTFQGTLRYASNHNFVQSACGEMSRQGDFLLEITNVSDERGNKRTNILLHPGWLPRHSEGCVLVGQRKRDSNGGYLPLDPDSPLRKLRMIFYGSDNPIACPDKRITINIVG